MTYKAKNYSTWNAVDLHIHSPASNWTKENDYPNYNVSARDYLEKLIENKISIFSITDHNCVNVDLYNKLIELIETDEFESKISVVLGVELDISDKEINQEVFHCICLVDTLEVEKFNGFVSKLFYDKDYKNRTVYPDIKKIFNELSNAGINNFILLPHFNNKSKGIKDGDQAVKCLNYLCFDAYEDSNNVRNIQKSLNAYIKSGFSEFPFVAFTDNHDIKNYPNNKDGKPHEVKCYMLSNVKFPFDSIKTCFQEPKMRISLSNISNMRQIETNSSYIETISINDLEINLSPSQNTIIGKFGSGKTFLFEKVIEGNQSFETNDKYKDIYDKNEIFRIKVDGQDFNSVKDAMQASSLTVYKIEQQEQYLYKNQLSLDDTKELFKRLNIEVDYPQIPSINFNENKLIEAENMLNNHFKNTNHQNIFNYERAFDKKEYYTFTGVLPDFNDFDVPMKELNNLYNNLQSDIIEIKLFGKIPLFNVEEKQISKNYRNIISLKIKKIKDICGSKIFEEIASNLTSYLNKYSNNNSKNAVDLLTNDLNSFVEDLNLLCNKACDYENYISEDKFNELIKGKTVPISGGYSYHYEYASDVDFKDSIESIIKSENRNNSFFASIVKTLNNNSDFLRKQTFETNVKKYCDFVKDLFTLENIRIDLNNKNESLLKKSAGEKSSTMIKFIFDLILDDLSKNKNVILFIDQPEDNIDNETIYEQISNKIKDIKFKYNNFQSIIITHNANVCIASDSENIIIASEKVTKDMKKIFSYRNGCIENRQFVEDVCSILEGGKDAMKRRTLKYGINIIKGLKQNEI